jgi:hypothetical protein
VETDERLEEVLVRELGVFRVAAADVPRESERFAQFFFLLRADPLEGAFDGAALQGGAAVGYHRTIGPVAMGICGYGNQREESCCNDETGHEIPTSNQLVLSDSM